MIFKERIAMDGVEADRIIEDIKREIEKILARRESRARVYQSCRAAGVINHSDDI